MDSGLVRGAKYRAYREFTGNTVIRFVATTPFLLTSQSLYVDSGAARAVISLGGIEGGTWTPALTVFPKNALNALASGFTFDTGGTITSSVEREVLRASTGVGTGASSGTGQSIDGERVLPAGTYYMTITVTGTTSGIYKFEFEVLTK